MKSVFRVSGIRTLIIVVLIALFLAIMPIRPGRAADDPPYKIFLPLVTRPYVGISGRVTLNGVGYAGENYIELCYVGDPADHNCMWITTPTNTNGDYYFSSTYLVLGRTYDTDYWNLGSTSNGKLFIWVNQNLLPPYTENSSLVVPTFDIADVELVSPGPNTTISLPYTFHWNKRLASPTDSYQFRLYSDETYFTSAQLGYADSFQLNSLPAGFSPNTAYSWAIGVYSPEGGHGRSFSEFPVTFSNSGASLLNLLTDWRDMRVLHTIK